MIPEVERDVGGDDDCYRIGYAAACQKCVGRLCLSMPVLGHAKLISHADGGHAPFSLPSRNTAQTISRRPLARSAQAICTIQERLVTTLVLCPTFSTFLFLVLMNVRTEPLAISALACDSYACTRLKVVATLRRLGGGGSLCKDCGLRTA